MDSERHPWPARFAWASGFTALAASGVALGPAAAIAAVVALVVLGLTAVQTRGRGWLGGLAITVAVAVLFAGALALLAEGRRPSWTFLMALLALVLAVVAVVVALRRRPRATQ